jgi:hypothetical protein
MSISLTKLRIYAEPEPGVSPILVRVWLENPSESLIEITFSATIAGGEFLPVRTTLRSQSTQVVNLLGGALKVIPWDLEKPTLYPVCISFSPSPPTPLPRYSDCVEREKGEPEVVDTVVDTCKVGFRRLRWDDLAKTLSINGKPVVLESLKKVDYSDAIDISEVLDVCDAQGEGVILCASVKEFPEAIALLANHASILLWQLTDTEIDEITRRSLSRLDETRPVWC